MPEKIEFLSPIFGGSEVLGLTLKAPTPQNGQTHSNNSSATADELFQCVWLFCGVGP